MEFPNRCKTSSRSLCRRWNVMTLVMTPLRWLQRKKKHLSVLTLKKNPLHFYILGNLEEKPGSLKNWCGLTLEEVNLMVIILRCNYLRRRATWPPRACSVLPLFSTWRRHRLISRSYQKNVNRSFNLPVVENINEKLGIWVRILYQKKAEALRFVLGIKTIYLLGCTN